MDGLTGTELAIALLAWVLVSALAALVLLLYQQLDRAYGLSSMAGRATLHPGDPIPPLEVLSVDDGLALQEVTTFGQTLSVTFVTGTCSSCIRLLRELLHAEEPLPRTAVIGVSDGDLPRVLREGLLASPIHVVAVPDANLATRDWGVTEVPTTFVFDDGALVASGPTRSLAELRALGASDAVAVP